VLPAKYRLKDKKVFNKVFCRGNVIANEVLVMKFRSGTPLKTVLGFSVGLKFSKKAAERNRIKRWMREAVRKKLENIRPGYEIVFLINSKYPYNKISFSLIQEKTENLLKQAKIIP
jgi:ribonuclease P protein component